MIQKKDKKEPTYTKLESLDKRNKTMKYNTCFKIELKRTFLK